MKKLIVMFFALIVLCSCGKTETLYEEPGISLPEDTNPVPSVFLNDEYTELTKFGYNWDTDNGDGTRTNVIACGIHPLECEDILNMHAVGDTEMKLVFEEEPVSYELIRYEVDENRWVEGLEYTGNEVSEPVETVGDVFALSNDGKSYVYVLDVKYENGSCQYAAEIYSPKPTVERYLLADTLEDGSLLVAKESGGLSILKVGDTPVFLDGEPADASVLTDGMQMQIKHGGYMLESYPSYFGGVYEIHVFSRGTKNDPMGTYFDICGLYTKALCDLWKADSGLNSGAEIVSIDLSKAPGGLSEGQKKAIVYMFMQEMKKSGEKINGALSLTREELIEEGWLTAAGGSEDLYCFDKGVLLSISEHENENPEHYSLPVVNFDAMKWRSPLGAYIFYDCKSVWPQSGTWSEYTIGSEMIS